MFPRDDLPGECISAHGAEPAYRNVPFLPASLRYYDAEIVPASGAGPIKIYGHGPYSFFDFVSLLGSFSLSFWSISS